MINFIDLAPTGANGSASRAPTVTRLPEVQQAALAELLMPPPAAAKLGHIGVACSAFTSRRESRYLAAIAFEVLGSGMTL